MNKEIQEKALKLNEWILKQDVVIEFKKYEKMIQDNKDLRKQEEDLKQMQQLIVQQKHQGIDCEQLIQDYEIKKKLFDENPIVFNYLSLKQDVNDLINQIQDDINQQLNKKVD